MQNYGPVAPWMVILSFFCVPFMIAQVIWKGISEDMKSHELKRWPRNTLHKKRRSLTPPPLKCSRLRRVQRSVRADQSASLLLSKLPWELREMIWKQVVGGRYIHLGLCRSEAYRGRLGYILCQSTDPCDWPRCTKACYRRWHDFQPESLQRMSCSYNVKPWKPPLIELLQTCHQM